MDHKRTLSALLCLTMLSGLASCSKTEESGTSATAATVTESTASSESTAASESETSGPSQMSGFEYINTLKSFEVTSNDLKDGVWSDINANKIDANKSPDLSWEAVDGAGLYVIFMIDPDAGYWLHWKSDAITETSLAEGQATRQEYVGPYPPPGSTHTYDVYVFALKAPVERVRGLLNGSNDRIEEFILALDTDANGNSGNMIACGRLSGTYTEK